MHRTSDRATPCRGTVVAYVALFIALGGTGYAASAARTASADRKAPQVRADERRASLRVSPTQAAAGGYGLVSKNGLVARASNVSAVTHPATGVYCIALNAGDPRRTGLLVTPDFTGDTSSFATARNHAIAEWRSGAGNCGSGTFEVETALQRSDGSIERVDQAFFFSAQTAAALFSAQSTGSSPVDVPSGFALAPNPLLQLDLPAGVYAITAKLNLFGGVSSSNAAVGDCRLIVLGAEEPLDIQDFALEGGDASLALHAAANFTVSRSLALQCRNFSAAHGVRAQANWMHLTAIRVS